MKKANTKIKKFGDGGKTKKNWDYSPEYYNNRANDSTWAAQQLMQGNNTLTGNPNLITTAPTSTIDPRMQVRMDAYDAARRAYTDPAAQYFPGGFNPNLSTPTLGFKKYGGKMKKAPNGISMDGGIPGESQIRGYNPNSDETMGSVQQGYNSMNNINNDPIATQQQKPNQGLPGVSPSYASPYNQPQTPDIGNNSSGNSKFKFKMGGLNPKGGINTSDLFMGSLGMISALLPNTPMGSNVNPLHDAFNPYSSGTGSQAIGKDGIHIKPSHKGRFTTYKERTGETTEEALHSKDPHVRQMANFARNFGGKKEDGGKIEYMMGGFMGGPVGMPGQMATMTNNMGSATPQPLKKSKKKMLNGGYVDEETKDQQEAQRKANMTNPNYNNYGSMFSVDKTSGLFYNQANDWPEQYQQPATRPYGPINGADSTGYIPTTPGIQREQQPNWHTNEDTNYSIDSLRESQMHYGGVMKAADGVNMNYTEGSEHDLSIQEIKRLEKLGYKLQY